jgi:Uri superfamily endonuclease
VSATIRIRVGRLGVFRFRPGTYVYTGRAARGLKARVLRHIRGSQCKHWHIDYLLGRSEVRLQRVTLASGNPADECRVNQATPGRPVIRGFGASDCRQGCGAHLRQFGPGSPG